jgi:hypothetical protein
LSDWIHIQAGDTQAAVDPELGNLRVFAVSGREVLHTAHWVEDGVEGGTDAPVPIERKLAGDFFCAPFGGGDLPDTPAHGWTANSSWSLICRVETGASAIMKFELDRSVRDARVSKEVTLKAGHPAVYQKHVIRGGSGPLTYAHHPMVSMKNGGHIGFSTKRLARTPAKPLEPKHILQYPAQTTDFEHFPDRDGGSFNLHSYPKGRKNEDFITLIEAPETQLGWTAVTREEEGDIVLFLKDPRSAPVTMLWYSNGGRDYAPWNSQHIGVLGVEDGCTAGAATVAEACSLNPISETGVQTAVQLTPQSVVEIRHAILAISRPVTWRGVCAVERVANEDLLRLTGLDGDILEVPFDVNFFN